MKRILMLAAAACLSAPAAAQTDAVPAKLVGAQEYRLQAAANGRTYRIQVAAVGTEPAGGYPVLYVLDGDAVFPVVVPAVQGMVMRAEENRAAPFLIVGVGYSDTQILDLAARAEDYTPPADDYRHTGDRLSTRFGGAEAFHSFLTGQLRQDLAKRGWRTNPQHQNLIGHSYGGLFALYSLMKHPGSFRNYLIASPSVWWNRQRILDYLPPFLNGTGRPDGLPVGVHLTVGEYEQTPAPHLPQQSGRRQQLERRGMVRETQNLGARLAALPASRLEVQTVVYPAETHASVLMPAVNDGLKWLFARCRADTACSTP